MNATGPTNEGLGLKELVAMGVGGMVGGGIFSVLGLAVGLAGHAAPWPSPWGVSWPCSPVPATPAWA